ncbi:unnamed protein product [Polarella glacialis]|uniref:Uncharacterized protein n=1 Tax=Polarella glacialis TaxID=89957 RepID=A0A813KXJ7_POLGL|nr:unnamed protein product [Polarella glacialis]
MAEQSIFGGVAPPEDFSQFPAAFNLPPPPAPVAPAAGGIRAMLAARLGGGLAQDPAVAQRAQVQAEAAELLSWSRQDLGAFPPAGPAFNQFDAGGAGGGSTFLQSPAFAKSSGAPPSGFGGLPSGLGGGDFGGGLGGLAGLPSSFTSAASSSSQAPAPDYISEETMASLPASMRVLIQARQQAAQATAAATGWLLLLLLLSLVVNLLIWVLLLLVVIISCYYCCSLVVVVSCYYCCLVGSGNSCSHSSQLHCCASSSALGAPTIMFQNMAKHN